MVQNAKTAHEEWLQGGKGPAGQESAVEGLLKLPPSPSRIQGRARDIYRETGKLLVAAGMLARPDLGLLERYAGLRAYAEDVAATLITMPIDVESKEQAGLRAYQLKISAELRQLEQALGLNPVARARMGKHQPPAADDALGALISRQRAARHGAGRD